MSNPSESLMTSSKPLMTYVSRRLVSIADSLDERMDEVALRLAIKRLDFLERKLAAAEVLSAAVAVGGEGVDAAASAYDDLQS